MPNFLAKTSLQIIFYFKEDDLNLSPCPFRFFKRECDHYRTNGGTGLTVKKMKRPEPVFWTERFLFWWVMVRGQKRKR